MRRKNSRTSTLQPFSGRGNMYSPPTKWPPRDPSFLGRHWDRLKKIGLREAAETSCRSAGVHVQLAGWVLELIGGAASQAIAAVGQCRLIALWDELFKQLQQPVAQILLTRNDIADVSLTSYKAQSRP